MDVLMLSLCCIMNPGLLCGSLNNDTIKLDNRVGGQWNLPNSSSMCNGELHLDGWMLAGCKSSVMKFCLMNKESAQVCACHHTIKEKALRPVFAITHVLCCQVLYLLL